MKQNYWKYVAIFAVFVLVVVVAWNLTADPKAKRDVKTSTASSTLLNTENNPDTASDDVSSDTSTQFSDSSTQASTNVSATTKPAASPAAPQKLSCAAQLKKDTEAKGTKYEKGTIMISLTSSTTFDTGKKLLATYGIRIENEAQTREDYGKSTTKLVIGVVAAGQEFAKICEIKTNPNIKFAGLNVLLDIHE